MELEEAEDEEWDTTSTSQYKYSSESEPNANNGGKVKCVLKKILVAGFVASSAPLVIPPLVIASAIGVVVSMPYAIFLASHTCTQNLMNKLLPRPQAPSMLQDFCFQPDIDNDIAHISKEEWFLNNEAKRNNEIVDVNGEKEIFEFGGVTDVVLEECCDEVKEGGIEEEELQRETKGLLEKIRDEGRNDMRGEYVEGICRGTNESDQDIGLVVENMQDKQSFGIEGEMRNGENSQANDCEVESCEPVRGNLEVDITNDSQKPMAEETCELLDERGLQYESIPAERIRDLLIETQVFDISVAEEDSSEVTNDNNISDFENQEMQMHEDRKIMDSSDADARKIADESGLPSCDENPDACSYTIDLHYESSNVAVDPHTDSMELLVSSVELDSRSSESSSGKNIVRPSEEVLLNEGDIWKEIHAIRKIIGYEVTSQASCVDELKALYIFTGVEPPTFVKENPFDLAEINEKLHFLMSIVGIKSNVP